MPLVVHSSRKSSFYPLLGQIDSDDHYPVDRLEFSHNFQRAATICCASYPVFVLSNRYIALASNYSASQDCIIYVVFTKIVVCHRHTSMKGNSDTMLTNALTHSL